MSGDSFHKPSESYGYRSRVSVDEGLRSFMISLYNHMAFGLLISALIAFALNRMSVVLSADGAIVGLTSIGTALYVSPLKWVLVLSPLAFIFLLSMRLDRLSYEQSRLCFYAFSAVMGASLSTIFLVYTQASIVRVFFVASASFAGLSLYGYTTERSLSGLSSFLFIGIIGLVLASLINLFVQSSAFQYGLSVIGVFVFAGFIAYDTQRLKEMYLYSGALNKEDISKLAVSGALSLYLNFINLFQSLLVIMGDRR